MSNKKLMVIVTPRPHANLELLSRIDGPLSVPCGVIGPSLARQVLAGNGRVVIPASHLRTAFDTQDGVNALLDNFDFAAERTQAPLLFELLKPAP
ncbi:MULTISPECIES: hypothetical protein [unclassified Janthinobacterium]|uniref:hypothetical protein n=1 Tax=unclassified Janthinobacterium TaxID=2610881 RepID=UPI001C58BC40|nr:MULTISPECIES: hypothetical protein [unclassified Janthinobacterium]MBW3512220.1 hypothetical protein [Janthinobacterium sp. NKUCC06_STL]